MPELGETDDPTELIPGDPAAIRALAANWHNAGTALDNTGNGLATLSTPQWSGPAQRAYANYTATSRTNWLSTADGVRNSSTAISGYADVLEWGQGEAAAAVDLWHSGQQAQATARLDAARQQVDSAGTDAANQVEVASFPAPGGGDDGGDDGPDPNFPPMPPSGPGNSWSEVVGAHPDPGTITADNARAHIIWGEINEDGDHNGGHYYDSGAPGKSVFPESWTPDDIMEAVTDVANNPDLTPIQQGDGSYLCTGTRNGVTMDVVVAPDGTVRTAYPTAGAGVCVNDENGEPQPLPNQNEDDLLKTEQQAQGENEDQAGAEGQAEITAQAQAQAEAEAAAEAEAEAEAEALAEAEAMALGDE